MTLSELIDEIVSRTRVLDICSGIQDARAATTYTELVNAGIDFIEYAYLAGIVDDALLAEFPEADLNALGIYTTGTFSLSAVDNKVYIMKDAVVDISYDGFRKGELLIMGAAVVTIELKDNTFANISIFNDADVTINVQSEAIAEVSCRDDATVDITTESYSMLKLLSRGKSIITLAAIDNSYIRAKTHQFSALTYSVDDAAEVVTTIYNSSTVNEVAP